MNMEEIVSVIPVSVSEILGFNLATLVALGVLFALLLAIRQSVRIIMPRFLTGIINENKLSIKALLGNYTIIVSKGENLFRPV